MAEDAQLFDVSVYGTAMTHLDEQEAFILEFVFNVVTVSNSNNYKVKFHCALDLCSSLVLHALSVQ